MGEIRTVLVTGANGFVGRWLTASLRQALPQARIVGSSTKGSGSGDTVRLDLRDDQAVADLIGALKPDAVINLAALSTIKDADKDLRSTFDVNALAPFRLAEAAWSANPDCRFVFVGSSEVYGGTFCAWGRAVDETAPLDPMNLYACAKAAGEFAVGLLAKRGAKVVIFRPFNHTGPGQSERFALADFVGQITRIERGEQAPLIRTGNLDAERDYVDVRDIVAAYTMAITTSEPVLPGSVLNLASGKSFRIGDLLEHLLSRARVRIVVEPDPERMRPSETPLVLGDARRAEKILSWRPKIGIHTTLDDMLKAARV